MKKEKEKQNPKSSLKTVTARPLLPPAAAAAALRFPLTRPHHRPRPRLTLLSGNAARRDRRRPERRLLERPHLAAAAAAVLLRRHRNLQQHPPSRGAPHRPLPHPRRPPLRPPPLTDPAPSLVDAATASAVSRADLRRLVASSPRAPPPPWRSEGSVVLLLLPNSVAFPVSFLAVLAAGAVATTMNPSSSPAEIAAQARATGACLVLASRDGAARLPPLAAPVVLVPEILDHSAAADDGDDDQRVFAAFRAMLDGGGGDGTETAVPVVGQDDAAVILYSSGTSGRSKGVVLTHRNLIAMTELFVRFEASQYHARGARENVYMAALPMSHVYGLSLFAVGLLSLGATVVVMRRFDAGDAVAAIGRYKVTHMPLVPPIMAAMVRAAAAGGVPPSQVASLVQVSCGAAPITAALIHEFLQAFPHVDFIQVMSSLFHFDFVSFASNQFV